MSVPTRTMSGAIALAILAALGAMPAHAVDANSASFRSCESVINADVKKEKPKAKSIAWEMSTVREHSSSNAVTYSGEGTYKGVSGKKRTFDFECKYDTKKNTIASGWWQSSVDNKRYTIYTGSSNSHTSGPSEDDIQKSCLKAVDSKVRQDFEHSIRKVELIDDSIDATVSGSRHKLVGQGRFLGGGGNWHRFDFTCKYDADDEKVTDVTWKHLGDEKGLDD